MANWRIGATCPGMLALGDGFASPLLDATAAFCRTDDVDAR
jgi:hypothetical protein